MEGEPPENTLFLFILKIAAVVHRAAAEAAAEAAAGNGHGKIAATREPLMLE